MIGGWNDTWKSDVASFNWGAIILALIASAPGLLALLTRRKAVSERASVTAKRTTLDEFNALFEEQRKQIQDCRGECIRLIKTNQSMDMEIAQLKEQVLKLTQDLHEETERRRFLEHVVRMRGGESNGEGGK